MCQVVKSVKALNMTFEPLYNTMAYRLDPSLCQTANTDCQVAGDCDCKSGSCDAPKRNCYYTDEVFSLGDPVQMNEVTLSLEPSAILNTSAAVLLTGSDPATQQLITRYAAMGGTLPCYETTRYVGADDRTYFGEPLCDFWDQEVLPSSCRRCTRVLTDATYNVTFGPWSGRLMYRPVYLQRHRYTRAHT